MEQIVVKTEVQPNGDILLFYVDENRSHGEGELTKLENMTQDIAVELQESDLVLNNVEETIDKYDFVQCVDQLSKESWLDEEIQKLLVFYIDNKESFINNSTAQPQLWAVACKTTLEAKNPSLCEIMFQNLKQKYSEICMEQQKGEVTNWPFFDLCRQAFHDDRELIINENIQQDQSENMPINPKPNEEGILVMKKLNSVRTSSDGKVEQMLNMYLKYKKNPKNYHSHRGVWEAIALELGVEDADYWHRRFLNFKQHYIRMVCKRNETGPEKINWPYMKLFDEIFDGDEDFQRKFSYRSNLEQIDNIIAVSNEEGENNWNNTEKTVLVKYYFDCFYEFQDPTIPNNFLWHEIGRLLDKQPENCKQKYREMKKEHFDNLMEGGYNLPNRIPIAIIYDNIIARETEIEISKTQKRTDLFDSWNTKEMDELVQYFYDNVEMFKDSACYYVCWNIVAKKLGRNIHTCKKQWEELTRLYKSILEDKKENPDMQIDWRYIDIFDRIFDYGMDTNLLEGYENIKVHNENIVSDKVGVKKLHIKDEVNDDDSDDEESYDERGFTKRSKRRTDESKDYKILEYYQKNKDKFTGSLRKKLSVWETLAKQLHITATQCAHRFRNIKQVYMGYVQKEINKPEMPILWPYYALCKKVFGYRAIKSKLKNGKRDSDDDEEWTAREIKLLINYFSNNFNDLCDSIEDVRKWSALVSDIGKTATACSEKFLELRKSYRKLKTMKSRNPEVKVSWKYFNMIDNIYITREAEKQMEADEGMETGGITEQIDVDGIKTELPEDEDFEYIIVIPEDQELSGNNNLEVMGESTTDSIQITEETIETKSQINKWNKRLKKNLLVQYLKYLKANKGKEIDSREMWKEISTKLNKLPLACRRILLKLKNQHKLSASDEEFKRKSPYFNLMEKILRLKPKFAKIAEGKALQEKKSYKDVAMSDEKVERALQYYLDNMEEFLSPRFEKKYVWMELAILISEPVNRVFNKINYLKHLCNNENSNTSQIPFRETLQLIINKENLLKDIMMSDAKPVVSNEGTLDEFWSDDEIEQLLLWYLTHLDKFKNPKYVRSYLWMEASEIMKKSPLTCSKKMSEIRTQYRTMVREALEELNDWRFYSLCQKIYGTGKKNPVNNN
ncbi:unnamed protein product [Parnassius apollo]|uniref:(apollo) hypothetical protein n=1 Tax=Parnassius apollo TaxID=110799 RepID=A0A8S3XXN9_PARAO|nr:unnamed protein product [Parnassius apollo]